MCLNSGVRNLLSAYALNCVKMRSNSERYRYKERGTLSVICVNRGDRNLLRDREPIVCLNSGARNLLSA